MNAEEAFKEWEVLPHSKIIIGKAMDGTLRDMDLEQIHKDGYNAAKPGVLQQIAREYNNAKTEGSWDESHPIFKMAEHIDQLQNMLRKKLDLIKCGIAHNYSGDPYENELYTEAAELVLPAPPEQ